MIEYSLSGPIPPLESVATPITAPLTPGPPDIFPKLIPKSGQIILAGATNSGKTLCALEICSSFITGNPLWGELTPAFQAKKILFILGEHNEDTPRRLALHTKLPFTDKVFLLGPEKLSFDKWLVHAGKPNQVAVSKMQKWAEGCDLVVFDPLSAFLTGGGEAENDNITMRLVLDMMGLITQHTGASCLVLAHQGKPMMDPYGNEKIRKSYAIRGASAIEDAATNIFYLEKGQPSSLSREAGGEMFDLVCRKYKGESVPKFTLLRDKATLTHRLLSDNPQEDLRKMETRKKVFNYKRNNPRMDDRTIYKMIADGEGVSSETVMRWLGLHVG